MRVKNPGYTWSTLAGGAGGVIWAALLLLTKFFFLVGLVGADTDDA